MNNSLFSFLCVLRALCEAVSLWDRGLFKKRKDPLKDSWRCSWGFPALKELLNPLGYPFRDGANKGTQSESFASRRVYKSNLSSCLLMRRRRALRAVPHVMLSDRCSCLIYDRYIYLIFDYYLEWLEIGFKL